MVYSLGSMREVSLCFISIHFISLSCNVYVYLFPGRVCLWFTGNVIKQKGGDPVNSFCPLVMAAKREGLEQELIINNDNNNSNNNNYLHTPCHIEIKDPIGMKILREH